MHILLSDEVLDFAQSLFENIQYMKKDLRNLVERGSCAINYLP